MKVLVIASEPISADRLRTALGNATGDAEIMVVAPALHRSALRFWLSDADDAIRRAELEQHETVEGLADEGLNARVPSTIVTSKSKLRPSAFSPSQPSAWACSIAASSAGFDRGYSERVSTNPCWAPTA